MILKVLLCIILLGQGWGGRQACGGLDCYNSYFLASL